MLEPLKQLFSAFPQQHLHPLVVHFPIGLWVMGALLFFVSLFPWFGWLRTPAIVVGVLGSLMGWVAAETGEIAANIVSPGLCDPSLLHFHEQQAETALIFLGATFGIAAVFQFIQNKFLEGREAHVLIRVALCVGMVLGLAYLTMAGHKGFRLVFEQGAAVKTAQPCK